uniref:Putative secreted protein n=1 Tax=Anopheles triannulatus TaxID=58253 RepID=A0A2M4B2E5_9DIPT
MVAVLGGDYYRHYGDLLRAVLVVLLLCRGGTKAPVTVTQGGTIGYGAVVDGGCRRRRKFRYRWRRLDAHFGLHRGGHFVREQCAIAGHSSWLLAKGGNSCIR